MILTLWQKILAAAIAIVLALVIGFGAGWTVERWHAGSQNASAYQKQMDDMQSAMAQAAKTAKDAADKLAAQNQSTEQDMLTLLTKMGDQEHAFAQVRTDISHIHVGTCQFDPAAYSLSLRAYEAAFGNSASSPGEAGSGNGKTRPTPASR